MIIEKMADLVVEKRAKSLEFNQDDYIFYVGYKQLDELKAILFSNSMLTREWCAPGQCKMRVMGFLVLGVLSPDHLRFA